MAKEFTREYVKNREYRTGIARLTQLVSRESGSGGVFALGRSSMITVRDVISHGWLERIKLPTIHVYSHESDPGHYAEWMCERMTGRGKPMVIEDTFASGSKIADLVAELDARRITPDIVVLVPPRRDRLPCVRFVMEPNEGLSHTMMQTRSSEALVTWRAIRAFRKLLA